MIMRGTTKRSISRAGLFGIVAVAALVLPTLPTWGQNDAEDADQTQTKQAAPKQSAPKSIEESGAAPVSSVDPFGVSDEPNKPTDPKDKTARREVEYLPRPSAIEQRIAEALEKPTTLVFEEESLKDIFQFLQDLHKISIFFDRRELEGLDIFPNEETVTINLTGLTLRSGLRLLLDQLGLDYTIQNDVLTITSADKVKKTLLTRVYLVGDLWTDPKDAEKLAEAIQKTVSPDSWDPVGSGTIVPITKSRSLVIRQNYRVHEELVRFLRALRAAHDLKDVAKGNRGGLDIENQVLNPFGQPKGDRPDGEIVYVSSRLGLVWVNLGSDDDISSGQGFVVYSRTMEGTRGKRKAEIEVTRVRAPHLSEARILEKDARVDVPISEGDFVSQKSRSTSRGLHFALAGIIDLDGDGKSDRQVVQDVIRNAGGIIVAELLDDATVRTRHGGIGINTRYLILGDRPGLPVGEGPTDASEAGVLEGMSRMIVQTRNAGVEIIGVEEFLQVVGYEPIPHAGKPEAGPHD